MRETDVHKRGNIRLIELNYAGASGDRVPAYLLIPPGAARFPPSYGALADEKLAARQ